MGMESCRIDTRKLWRGPKRRSKPLWPIYPVRNSLKRTRPTSITNLGACCFDSWTMSNSCLMMKRRRSIFGRPPEPAIVILASIDGGWRRFERWLKAGCSVKHDNIEWGTRVSGLTPQLVTGTIGTRSDWGLNWTSQAVTMELDQAKVGRSLDPWT